MIVILEFDFDSKTIFIPDGYINDIKKVQSDFFEWLYIQSSNFLKSSDKQYGVCYNSNDFVKYLNNTVLSESNEKAYIVKTITDKGKSMKIPILKF